MWGVFVGDVYDFEGVFVVEAEVTEDDMGQDAFAFIIAEADLEVSVGGEEEEVLVIVFRIVFFEDEDAVDEVGFSGIGSPAGVEGAEDEVELFGVAEGFEKVVVVDGHDSVPVDILSVLKGGDSWPPSWSAVFIASTYPRECPW